MRKHFAYSKKNLATIDKHEMFDLVKTQEHYRISRVYIERERDAIVT